MFIFKPPYFSLFYACYTLVIFGGIIFECYVKMSELEFEDEQDSVDYQDYETRDSDEGNWVIIGLT